MKPPRHAEQGSQRADEPMSTPAPASCAVSRRSVLRGASLAAALSLVPVRLRAAGADGWGHAFSPIGAVGRGPDFVAFGDVDPDAPKGGVLRVDRVGAFDTIDTLTYRGRPPADLRLVYDRLFVAAPDERASVYGLLARRFRIADDFSRIDMELDPEARWHDGRPVVAEDVRFTFETLKAAGAPFYRQAFLPLTVEVADDRRVAILNSRTGDRDLVRRLATIPVHPAHVWRDGPPADASGIVGSGPYRVAVAEPPRLVLERVPDYWALNHGVNRGRWNFDKLDFDHHRDATVALEAFRGGASDVRFEDDPGRWRTGYDGPALASGAIRRIEAKGTGSGALTGLVFNLRRPSLARRNVRLALHLLFDFAEMNRLLYDGAYSPFASVFGETELAAEGAAGADERALLRDAGATLPAAALADPDPLDGLPAAGSREALALASRLLDEEGFVLDGSVRVGPDGTPLRFEVVAPDPRMDRPVDWLARSARRIGVDLRRVQADPNTAGARMLGRDFDLAALAWEPQPLPGTAERLLWHSALADAPDSYALAGLRDPVVDAAVKGMERARAADDLRAAARLFDRSFLHALAMLPLWRSNTVRLACWDRFGRPDTLDLPPSPVETWWAAG